MLDDWLTIPEMAKMTGYKMDYLRRLLRSNKLKARKSGRDWLVKRSVLLAYMKPGAGSKYKKRYRRTKFNNVDGFPKGSKQEDTQNSALQEYHPQGIDFSMAYTTLIRAYLRSYSEKTHQTLTTEWQINLKTMSWLLLYLQLVNY